MPIYDYECQECKEIFEVLILKNSDPPQCPACKSLKLEQQISLFAVDSAGTRESSLRGVRAKNDNVRREYQHAQAEHERDHHH
ncbi:MAG: zinc ribbon domain-containing protein [Acidobacteriota bacterium]